MSNLLKLRVELADGCILVGEVVSVGSKPQFPESQQMKWYMDLLTDTLGKVEINAVHIAKMGPDPTKMQEFKDPVDVFNYVVELMRVAHEMPIEFQKQRG